MKLLKAIEKEKLDLRAELRFDQKFDTSDFNFGILSLERNGRSLYLDVVNSYTKCNIIRLYFEYDEDILTEDESKLADLKVQDLVLGLDEAKLYIGEDDYIDPVSMTLFVEGDGTELQIDLTID